MPKRKAGTASKPEIVPRERRPDGQPMQQADPRTAPTIIKRLKDELIPRANDRRLGSVLGLMHLEGILSEAEVEAGFRYANSVGAYERSKGHPARASQSQGFEFGRKGADGLDLEALKRMDPEVADKIEKSIRRKRKAVQKQYDRFQACVPLYPILISALVEEVCCNDRPIHSLHHPMLKKILRNMAKNCCPDLILSDKQGPRKLFSRKADAVMVAQGTVDAIEHWFAQRDGTVATFRLTRSNPHAPLGLSAYGMTGFGEEIEHTIHPKRSGLMAEAINAQLLKAATDKGWTEARHQARPTELSAEAIRAGIRKLKQEVAP